MRNKTTKQTRTTVPDPDPPPPPTGPSRGSRHWPIHSVSIIACPMLGNPRKFWILDSTPGIPDSRYWIPVFFNGTWILAPIVGGIPDSLSCTPNPHAKISQITESGFPYTGAIWSSNCSLQVKLWNPFTPCITKMQVTGAGIYSVYITKQHRSASGRLIIIPHSNTSAKVLFLVSIIQ